MSQCTTNGQDGYWYYLIRKSDDSVISEWCQVDGEAAETLWVLVRREYRSLQWPASHFQMSPKDLRPVINHDARVYTSNAQPTTQVISLLGQRVSIQARPTSYVWHFGDGETLTTDDPGAPYPAGTIGHTYLKPGPFSARVDTVYTGRFRVGGGPWIDIAEPLTVTGSEVSVTVLELKPQLVGP